MDPTTSPYYDPNKPVWQQDPRVWQPPPAGAGAPPPAGAGAPPPAPLTQPQQDVGRPLPPPRAPGAPPPGAAPGGTMQQPAGTFSKMGTTTPVVGPYRPGAKIVNDETGQVGYADEKGLPPAGWLKVKVVEDAPPPGQVPRQVGESAADAMAVAAHKWRLDRLAADADQRIKTANEQAARRPQLELLKGYINSGANTTSPEWVANVKRHLNAWGFLDPNDAAASDATTAFKKAVANLTPGMRALGSGSSSDKDMEAFANALPGFSTSREGNLMTVNGMLQVSRYMDRLAAARMDWITNNKNKDWTEDDWLKHVEGSPALRSAFRTMSSVDELRKGNPNITTQELYQQWQRELEQVRPGELYLTPDRKWRMKPEFTS